MFCTHSVCICTVCSRVCPILYLDTGFTTDYQREISVLFHWELTYYDQKLGNHGYFNRNHYNEYWLVNLQCVYVTENWLYVGKLVL